MSNKPAFALPTMKEIANIEKNGLRVASLFSGCGGSSLGYKLAGCDVIYAVEFVPEAIAAYRANHPNTYLDTRDVREVQAQDILNQVGEIDILDGSPPCQSFSTAGARSKGWGKTKKYSGDVSQRSDDLFFEYARILKDLQPKAFIAENVSGLVKGAAKGYFLDIIEALRNCGYRVKASVLDAQWLGVPQMRQRLFYVGFRNDLGLEPVFPSPLKYHYTVKDVLPHIKLVKFSGKANNYKAAGLNASPTIMANDYERKETAYFSGGGWIETMQGERRQFTIDELKIICTFPSDFYLPGSLSEQWERLGRAVPPFLMRALAIVVSNQLLKVSIHA